MGWLFQNRLNFVSNQKFHSSHVNLEQKQPAEQAQVAEDMNAVPLRPIDRRLLVWSGKYKRLEDVPYRASRAVVAKAHSVCRVKMCHYMTVGVIIGAITYIMSGKRARERGVSLTKMNQEWHEEYNRQYAEKQKKLAEA